MSRATAFLMSGSTTTRRKRTAAIAGKDLPTRRRYAPARISGLAGAIRDAHQRYQTAIAITEVHLACSAEEQLRWFIEAWETAVEARAKRVDVRALTVWSLLGAFDWDSLVTRVNGHYESGVFDVKSGKARPTLLAEAVNSLARGEQFDHPALQERGWWHRMSLRADGGGIACKQDGILAVS